MSTLQQKFQDQASAKASLKYDGKILSQQQMRIKLRQHRNNQISNIKKTEKFDEVQVYEEIHIQNHLAEATKIINTLTIKQQAKILLCLIFKIKIQEIIFLNQNKQNCQYNKLDSQIKALLLKQQQIKIQTNTAYDFMLLKTSMNEPSPAQQLKLMACDVDNSKKFVTFIKRLSLRLFQIYLVFERQSRIISQPLNCQQLRKINYNFKRFFGCIPASYVSTIIRNYKEFCQQNLLLYKPIDSTQLKQWQALEWDCVLHPPNTRIFQETSYFNIYTQNSQHEFQKITEIKFNEVVYILEVTQEIDTNQTASLLFEQIKKKISKFQQIRYNFSTKWSLLLIFPYATKHQQYKRLNIDIQGDTYVLHISNPILYQDLITNYFIENYVDSYKGMISEETAEFIAKNLIKENHQQLGGNYNIKHLTSVILDKQKEKRKRNAKSIVDRYSNLIKKL